ncbi:MAG: hypothetical protein U9N85_12245 [Bacteroidota bacterium]|nr:hypothetical protein [Bacteroidota bacterium]
MFKKNVTHILLLFFVLNPLFGISQSNNKKLSKSRLYKIAQAKYGTDDILVFGKLYFPLHRDAKGHPYTGDGNFSEGNIYIDGKTYKNIPLKFDTELRAVVIKSNPKNDFYKLIRLNPTRLDSFSLNNQYFIHSSRIKIDMPKPGFYYLEKGKYFSMAVYYYKIYYPTKGADNQSYGEYSDLNSKKYLILNDEIHLIKSRRKFATLFATNRKKVLKYLRKNKIRFHKATAAQLNRLIKYCNTLYEK